MVFLNYVFDEIEYNCHMVLHTGEGISVEELKKKVKKTKDKMKGSI